MMIILLAATMMIAMLIATAFALLDDLGEARIAVREREQGTFDQLLVTPLTPPQILLGKALPGLLIGLVEGSVILLAAVYWFEIPMRGSFLALYLGMFLFLLSGVGIGLMICLGLVTGLPPAIQAMRLHWPACMSAMPQIGRIATSSSRAKGSSPPSTAKSV